jgi:hypothetical protein
MEPPLRLVGHLWHYWELTEYVEGAGGVRRRRATLLDEGRYLCSMSTMHRLLRRAGQGQRKATDFGPCHAEPERALFKIPPELFARTLLKAVFGQLTRSVGSGAAGWRARGHIVRSPDAAVTR